MSTCRVRGRANQVSVRATPWVKSQNSSLSPQTCSSFTVQLTLTGATRTRPMLSTRLSFSQTMRSKTMTSTLSISTINSPTQASQSAKDLKKWTSLARLWLNSKMSKATEPYWGHLTTTLCIWSKKRVVVVVQRTPKLSVALTRSGTAGRPSYNSKARSVSLKITLITTETSSQILRRTRTPITTRWCSVMSLKDQEDAMIEWEKVIHKIVYATPRSSRKTYFRAYQAGTMGGRIP